MGRVHHMERCPNNAVLRTWLQKWDASGPFDIVIITGSRTDAEQLVDYAKGRKRLPDGSWVVVNKDQVVTMAQTARTSGHGHDSAADIHPVKAFFPGGGVKEIYLGDARAESPEDFAEAIQRFKVMAADARSSGVECGADYATICDRPHFADPKWQTNPVGPDVA